MPFWPLRRVEIAAPPEAQLVLAQIPGEFEDDGCSRSLDGTFRVSWRWVCKIHDWRGCTRAHPAGALTLDKMHEGNAELWHWMGALPVYVRPARWVYYAVLARVNGDVAWDSCGPKPLGVTYARHRREGLCRHGMAMPDWMKAGVTG
jgi:hypothetical protein